MASALLALGIAAFVAPSRADAVPVRLTWSAPSTCPDAPSVSGDLEHLTDGRVHVDDTAQHEVRGTISAQGGRYVLVLEVAAGDLHERRTVEAERCETLARASALMIAVAIAPVAATPRVVPPIVIPIVGPDAAQDAPRTAAPDDGPSTSAMSSTVVDPRGRTATLVRRDHGVLAVWTGPSLGTNPGPTAIVGGDLGWRRGAFGLQLSGWHAFATRRDVDEGIGVRASTSGGGARVIYAPRVGPIELPVAVGVDMGALAGAGAGTRVDPIRTRALWAAAVVSAGLAWPARGRFALALRADVLALLRRPGIQLQSVDGPRTVFATPQVGLRVLAGPLFRFP